MASSEALSSSWERSLHISDIDTLHRWIVEHPQFLHVSERTVCILYGSFLSAERIHRNDIRQNKDPYIIHPIAVVQSFLLRYPDSARVRDVLALILHDTIEDHEECWWDILSRFGIEVFRDVLILSKISIATRREILSWIVQNADLDNEHVWQILQILDPTNPLKKLQKFSKYSTDYLGEGSQRIRAAILLYKKEIIDKDPNHEEARDEYISLGNYLYFTEWDAKRKLRDMLHNMSDMESMEARKPGYIEKRRIKAYILWVKLKNFGLVQEFAELQKAFQDVWYQMYTDGEVMARIQNARYIPGD